MTAIVRIARELQPRVILVVGGLVFLLYAYPGVMTVDSVDQLAEARAGFFTDSHPPAMAALWRMLDMIISGPFLMLLLQEITFLAGTYLVLKRVLSPWFAALVATLVLLFPPIGCTLAVIWKDSLMAGMLALGTGLVMSSNRRVRVASLGCFAVATAVKYNAFAATLPLIVLLFEWTPGKRALVRYSLATGAWLGVTLGAMAVNEVLVDQPMHFWHSTLAVYDITGVINYEPTLSDDQLRRDLAGTGLRVEHDIGARARDLYQTHNLLRLVVGRKRIWNLPTSGRVPAPQAQRDAVASAWWQMVSEHPGAYLHHRAAFFLAVIGVTDRPFDSVPDHAMFEYQDSWSAAYRWLSGHTPLFRPWLYIVLGLTLLPLCRRDRAAAALLASGLVVEASLFFLAPSEDYRYSHWTIACACNALVMVVAQMFAIAKRER